MVVYACLHTCMVSDEHESNTSFILCHSISCIFLATLCSAKHLGLVYNRTTSYPQPTSTHLYYTLHHTLQCGYEFLYMLNVKVHCIYVWMNRDQRTLSLEIGIFSMVMDVELTRDVLSRTIMWSCLYLLYYHRLTRESGIRMPNNFTYIAQLWIYVSWK